jgi:Uma2 family endonuclease
LAPLPTCAIVDAMGFEERLADLTPHRAKLTAADFMLLNEAGAFSNYARSELIEGDVYVVNATYRRHAWTELQLVLALTEALRGRSDGLTALYECSSLLSADSLPQPDIVLTTEPEGDGPIPAETIRLVIEVADASLATDLGMKADLYARHNVPEYWVADVRSRRIHRRWTPGVDGYADGDEVAFGCDVASRTIEGLTIPTTAL